MAPVTPVAMPRPRTVTIAARLLYTAAVLPLLVGLVSVAFLGDFKHAAQRAATAADLPTAGDDATQFVIMALFAGVFGAALWAGLAWACGKGRRWARILLWIIAVGSTAEAPLTVSVLSHGYFDRKPDWYQPVYIAELLGALALAATAAILLSLPASRQFFRPAPLAGPMPQAPSPSETPAI